MRYRNPYGHGMLPTWLEAPMWVLFALFALLGWNYDRKNRRDWRYLAAAVGFGILCAGAAVDWMHGYNTWDPLLPPGNRYINFNSATMEVRGIGFLILLATSAPYLWKNRRIEMSWFRFYLTGRTIEKPGRAAGEQNEP